METAEKLELITLQNRRGTKLKVLNFGATVFSLEIDGKTNVVVAPKDPKEYLSDVYHQKGKYFGASVGRHAGRISGGGFKLKDEFFPLFGREGVHLHGGKFGFTYKFWEIKEVNPEDDPFVVMEYFSPDGEEGYPGNLQVQVKYTLTEENVVEVEYSAETDSETVVNLTNHTYFNLNGHGNVNEHELQIPANEVLESDERTVPTGRLLPVHGEETDFRRKRRIGKVELDTVFKFNGSDEPVFLKGEQSGITLQLETNQPAVVVYVPPTLPGEWEYSTVIGEARAAICLEMQKFPDAPNHDHFPSVVLKPGDKYRNVTRWKFNSGS